jgi:type VI secretion system protein ImpG
MNPDLLRYYSRELQHIREMGGEFANAFPKIAGRLGLESFECADPYVERLLEGFSFLAARVQMKIDAEFPRFTQHLAELVYPHYLAPTPAMTIVQLQPDATHPSLVNGVVVPRGTALHGWIDDECTTRCEFRTAHALSLSPLELVEARLFTHTGMLAGVHAAIPHGVKAGLRIRLRALGEHKIRDLDIDHLPIYLRGSDGMAARLHELLAGSTLGVATPDSVLPPASLRPLGFSDEEALLPVYARSFPGYRLLQEYFAFAQRFMFIGIEGLREPFARCEDSEIDLIVLLSRVDTALERLVDHANFALHCTPAINLFPRRAEPIAVTGEEFEHRVVVDRAHDRDFEVYQVQSVTGYRSGGSPEIAFQPFYQMRDSGIDQPDAVFYQVRRDKRLPSARESERGARSSYAGSETWIALVDTREAPYPGDLQQLGINVLCTNRDLTLTMPRGRGDTDFTLDLDVPMPGVRCVAGPSRPLPPYAQGAIAWRLLNHLSLNYASLIDREEHDGARAMRNLLGLYAPEGDSAAARQIDGLRSIRSRPVTRRLPSRGPIVFGRGLELDVLLDESGFEGAGAFLFGAVLARFFEQYVSMNSFTETIVSSTTRGEIMRWAPRSGQCRTL